MLASNLMLGTLVLINCCLFLWRAGHSYYATIKVSSSEPGFIGHDYPVTLDIGPLDTVAMTLHESVRFTLGNGTDEAVDTTWGTLFANPPGLGRVHLGKDDRILAVTFVHQLHCVRELARAFHYPRSDHFSVGHQQHCINYLRQTLLCDAADTLEEGDFTRRDFEMDRVGDTAVCLDWERVYDTLGSNFREWQQRNKDRGHEGNSHEA
ncbi:hypothetical protein JVU11DRAFT_10384 [Chiua virens]|nr:hypothetical protein JVU11DRAFT_10384 [Chiua virens]